MNTTETTPTTPFTLDEIGAGIEQQNTTIEDIDSEVVNLIFVATDESGSMRQWTTEMVANLDKFKAALTASKEADSILVARAGFSEYVHIGGYKKISQFDTTFSTSGMTKLYDVIVEGTQKLVEYFEHLRNQGMRVKAVFSVFSDGEENDSKSTGAEAKAAIDKLNSLEITTAFISFGPSAASQAGKLGFKNLLTTSDDASGLRKAFDCLSKSVIEHSKSVATVPADQFFTV